MKWIYILTPFPGWVIAGGLKFLINSIKSKCLAFGQIGYGGMPLTGTLTATFIHLIAS